MLKCIRFFSHHDSSFPLAYVAVPGIQSTPSLLLDGSTSAVVPSQIPTSASESKFQSFPFCWYIVRLMSTVYLPFLGTLTFAILQFSGILKKIEANMRNISTPSFSFIIGNPMREKNQY